MIVGRQRVAFVVVQPVAVRRHAGHEDVALQAIARGARGGFNVGRRGAALPIVGVIEDHLEPAIAEGTAQRRVVLTVALNV